MYFRRIELSSSPCLQTPGLCTDASTRGVVLYRNGQAPCIWPNRIESYIHRHTHQPLIYSEMRCTLPEGLRFCFHSLDGGRYTKLKHNIYTFIHIDKYTGWDRNVFIFCNQYTLYSQTCFYLSFTLCNIIINCYCYKVTKCRFITDFWSSSTTAHIKTVWQCKFRMTNYQDESWNSALIS